jgi:hypothetical protein
MHDTCETYQMWVKERIAVNSRRGAEADVKGAIVAARLRIRGKKK